MDEVKVDTGTGRAPPHHIDTEASREADDRTRPTFASRLPNKEVELDG
jgi:hypothetical protein